MNNNHIVNEKNIFITPDKLVEPVVIKNEPIKVSKIDSFSIVNTQLNSDNNKSTLETLPIKNETDEYVYVEMADPPDHIKCEPLEIEDVLDLVQVNKSFASVKIPTYTTKQNLIPTLVPISRLTKIQFTEHTSVPTRNLSMTKGLLHQVKQIPLFSTFLNSGTSLPNVILMSIVPQQSTTATLKCHNCRRINRQCKLYQTKYAKIIRQYKRMMQINQFLNAKIVYLRQKLRFRRAINQ